MNASNYFQPPVLLTVKQFCEKYPWMTEGSLRWKIFNAESLGLSKAIVRFGKRRLLISEKEFFDWLLKNEKG